MRQPLLTILVAFFAGLSGSVIGNRAFQSAPVYAQVDAGPKVLRVERLELVDQKGIVRGILDATEKQMPRLEFKDQFDGKERSLLLNASMVNMKLDDQSAIFSTMGAMLSAGKNQILLDVGSVGPAHDPQLIVSSAYGTGRVSSFTFDITDSHQKLIWATPIKLP